jgi:hypothetical protein
MARCRNVIAVAFFAGLVPAAAPLLAQTTGPIAAKVAARTGFSTLRGTESPGLRLTLVQPPPQAGALGYLEQQRVGDTRPPNVGVEFRAADHPAAGLLRGSLLRMQLDSGGTLALRMKSRGLAVVMKKEF